MVLNETYSTQEPAGRWVLTRSGFLIAAVHFNPPPPTRQSLAEKGSQLLVLDLVWKPEYTSQKMEALCICMWRISVHKGTHILGTWEITERPIYLKENILIDKHTGCILHPSGSCAYWLSGTWLLTWAMVSFFNNKVLREREDKRSEDEGRT